MKKISKKTSILLVIALTASNIALAYPASIDAASKKVVLSAKKMTITAGKTKKLKLKNNTKKVTWKVISGKNTISLKNKKKTEVTIRAKKKGTAKVQAKVAKKTYVCRIVVKAKKKKNPSTIRVSNPPSNQNTPSPEAGSNQDLNTKTPSPEDGSDHDLNTQTPSPENKDNQNSDAPTQTPERVVEVSGYIKTKNGTTIKGPFSIDLALKTKVESNSGWSSYEAVIDETGRYSVYLEPGEYVVSGFQYNEIPFEEDNNTNIEEAIQGSVVVGNEDISYDFTFDGYCAMGKVTRGGGIPWQGRFEAYPNTLGLSSSYTSDEFTSDEDGNYCFLVPSSTGWVDAGCIYYVDLKSTDKKQWNWSGGEELWTFDFANGDLVDYDLACDFYEVSGVITLHDNAWDESIEAPRNICREDESYLQESEYCLWTSYNEELAQLEYILYVTAGNYYLFDWEISEGFSVVADVDSFPINFNLYKIRIFLEREENSNYILDEERSVWLYKSGTTTGIHEGEVMLVFAGEYEVSAYFYTGDGSGFSVEKSLGKFTVPDKTTDIVLKY